MKIFQVITVSEYGGAQTIVANLIKALSHEHEVFVLYGGNGEAWEKLGNQFTRIRLNDHRKNVSWRDFFVLLKLFYYRFKYNPDVIHLHSSKMGALGRIAFSRKKIVYTMHGFDSVRKGFSKFLIIEKKLKNRAFRIVGVSQYDVDCLKEEGISKNTTLVYNGVTDHYTLRDDIEDKITATLKEVKTRYKRVVMCISRISKQKKFDLFVDVARHTPEHAFVWIGNKKSMPGLPDNVFCLGEAHSAHVYLKYADVFILPSNYEGLPMSLLEALSFKVPCVASAVGGIPEVLNEENGFAVKNHIEDFKKGIDHILADETTYNMMSDQARATYLANFSIDKMVDGYMEIYNSITRKKK